MSKRKLFFTVSAFALVFMWGAYAPAVEPTENQKIQQDVPRHVEPGSHEDAMPLGMSKQPVALFPVERDGQWGFMDKSGKLVVPPKYEDADFFVDGLARVELDGKWGYIGPDGKEVIKPQYEDAGNFSDGLARVKVDGKWGFIGPDGKAVIHPQYDWVGDFKDGVARVKHGTLFSSYWGYIDKSGKLVAGTLGKQTDKGAYREGGAAPAPRQRLDAAEDFSHGLAAAKVNGKWGFIDPSGNWTIKPTFENAGKFSRQGLANVEADGKWGYIDKSGNWVIKPQFKRAYPFSEGLAVVEVGGWFSGKYGYVDRTGKLVVPARYEEAGDFSDGLARVKADGKWGYIDKTGNFAISPQFSEAWNFQNGVARVKSGGTFGGKWVYIDKSGKIIHTMALKEYTPVTPREERHEHGR
jgi:hypothetical protein